MEGGETRVEGERACVLVNEWRLNEHNRGWTAGGPGGMREQRVAGGRGKGSHKWRVGKEEGARRRRDRGGQRGG